MKYRPSKPVVWLVIPLLPVMAMWVAVWIEEEFAASSIATRGSSPPRTRADTNAPGNPSDGEVLAEVYTLCSESLVKQNEHLALTDLPSHLPSYPGHEYLSRRSRAIAMNLGMLPYRFERRKDWERVQTQTGMILAAFAIFKGEPVPCDPIYGLPYRWDPVTRKLSEPELSAQRNQGMKSMILPKL